MDEAIETQVEKRTKVHRGLATQLRHSYDAIDDGVLVIDSEQVVIAVNDAFRKLVRFDVQFGDRIEDLPERLAGRLTSPVAFRTQWKNWLKGPIGDNEFGQEFELELKSPDPAFVVVRTAPVQVDDEDKAMGRIMMWRDETKSRQLQAELLHSNKLEAVGQLASGVAHDINNVLAAITGNLTVARLDKNLQVDSVDDLLGYAEQAAFRGADVVRRLLTFSMKADFELSPCGANDIIRRLSDLVTHTFDASIRFRKDLDRSEPVVNVQSSAIEQVLLNLYVNSRDAMPDGGVIKTSTRIVRELSSPDDWVMISVADTGAGVPEELVGRIFEPYVTTKESDKGTGLGLSVSYRVVTQHGGKLRYKKRQEGGSEFQILLPLATSTKTSTAPPKTCEEHSDICQTILIVDDEPAVRDAAQRILQLKGFQTLVAAGGAEAIAVISENPLAIDTVLLDLTMPGMSGREVMSVIRSRWPQLRVVLCSGYLMDERSDSNGADMRTNPPDGSISKPYSSSELVSVLVNAALAKSQ